MMKTSPLYYVGQLALPDSASQAPSYRFSSVVLLLWAGKDFEILLSLSLFLLNFFIEEVNVEMYFLANINCLPNTQRLKGWSGYYYFIVLNTIFFHYGKPCIIIDILRN